MIENIENKDILSFEIEKNIVNEKKIIGSFQKNITTIELLNPDNKYSNLKGTYIKTIKGTFFIDNIEPIQENIKVKLNCYDLSQKFDEEYDRNKFYFPMTLKEWKEQICDELNIKCDKNNFPNCDYIIERHPYIDDNATYRDVIKMIAQAGACWTIIDYDDILKFQWFDDTINNDIDDWFELTTEDSECEPVNMVVLGRGDVEDNVIYPENEPEITKEIRIDSNEILDINRRNMIIPIYNQVNNFKYTIFSMKTIGKLDAKVGQKITYLDIYKKSHESFIMKHILTFLGGNYEISNNWASKFEAIELDETNTNYKYAESIEEKTNKTERLANKLDGIISDVVERVGQYDDQISEVKQSYDSIKNSVSIFSDLTRNKKSTNKLYIKNVNKGFPLKLSIKNASQVYPSMETYPDYNLFPVPEDIYLVIDKEVNLTENAKQIKLPITYLASKGEVYDEFIIEKTNMYIIRRIGFDDDGYKYVLDNEIKEDLGTIDIELFEGDNYIYLYAFNDMGVIYEIDYLVKSDLTDIFATNVSVDSKIEQSATNINLGIDEKITDVNNEITELNSNLNIAVGSISTEVSKKVGNDEIISKINQSPEEISIDADKISLEGKEFNLTSDDITIKSTNFNVDKNGNLICNSGTFKNSTINGGNIEMISEKTVPKLIIKDSNNTDKLKIYSSGIDIDKDSSGRSASYSTGGITLGYNYNGLVDLSISNSISGLGTYGQLIVQNYPLTKMTEIRPNGISSPAFNNNSLVTMKKNIEPFNDAINLIKQADIYSYNWKDENDNDKKHYGLVIGEDYNTPEEFISKNGNGIDTYAMISICLQAIKEQQEQIEDLKKEIKELKEGNYEKNNI